MMEEHFGKSSMIEWREAQLYVLNEVKSLRKDVRELKSLFESSMSAQQVAQHKLDNRLVAVEVKSGIWGSLGGIISGIFINKFFGN